MQQIQTTRIDCFLEFGVEVSTQSGEEDPGSVALRIVYPNNMMECLLCRDEVKDLIAALQKHLGRVTS